MMYRKLFGWLLLVIFTLGLCLGCSNKQQAQDKSNTLRIAAAASLEKVFVQRLIPAFRAKHPNVQIEGVYDASGKLQKQIEQGLEADVFLSAASRQMQFLTEKGYMDKSTINPLLENKLVLIVPVQGKSKITSFADFKLAKQPAIGDPLSVPAGQYAYEALCGLQMWETLKPRLSMGTNVVQVLNWVAEGSADAGLVYATDAASNKKVRIVAEAPKKSLKRKIVYPVGVLQKTKEPQLAKEFVAFLKSEEAAKIFKEYGFSMVQ